VTTSLCFFQCSTQLIAGRGKMEGKLTTFVAFCGTQSHYTSWQREPDRAYDNEVGNPLFLLNLGTILEVDNSSKSMLSPRARDKELPIQHKSTLGTVECVSPEVITSSGPGSGWQRSLSDHQVLLYEGNGSRCLHKNPHFMHLASCPVLKSQSPVASRICRLRNPG